MKFSPRESLPFVLTVCFLLLAHAVFAGESLRILFLTDIHVTPGNDQDRAMEKVVEEIGEEKDAYDFAVITGDISNMGSDAELQRAKDHFDRLQLPYFIIPGNHETTWSDSACRTFVKLWGNDRFEHRHGEYYLIGFATGPYMKMGDGHVKAEDLHWLDGKLRENTKDPKTKVLVFSHYPIKSDLGNWPDVVYVLKKYPVAAVFCGHWHRTLKLNFGSIPGLMGRPLLYSTEKPPGYNVIEVKDDIVSLIPRELGRPQGEPFASVRMGDAAALEGIESDAMPAPIGGDLPEQVHVRLVRADEASIFGGLAIRGDRIFYGNSLGLVKACSVTKKPDGTPALTDRWQVSLGASVYSTPLIEKNRLVVGSANDELIGFDSDDGKRAWTIACEAPVTGDGRIVDGSLFMGLGRDEFCKIELETGRKIWTYKGVDGRFQGAPAIGFGTVAFGAWNQCLYALDAETGKENWVWKGGREGNLYSPGNVVPVVSESQVVIVAPDRFMTAIDRKTGRQLWRENRFKVRESTGSSPDGRVAYAKTMDGHVIAVSAVSEQFELLWDRETGVAYDHVPCPIFRHEKMLYYGSPLGVVVAVDAETGEKLWSYKTGNSAVNRFHADSQGRVWFTLVEGKIYCIENNP